MIARNPMARLEGQRSCNDYVHYSFATQQRKPFEVIQRETQEFLSSAAGLKRKLQGKRVLR